MPPNKRKRRSRKYCNCVSDKIPFFLTLLLRVQKECPVASALKAITLNLNMGVPPAQISAKVLFDKIGLRIDGILQKAGHNLIGQPLFKPMLPLTPVQWKKLQSHQSELESEYDLRREMMLIRLDVDVQKLKVCYFVQSHFQLE